MSSQTNQADRQSQQTPESLQRALLELLQDKPIEAITVSELTRRARYARSTFYAHYRDLDDFLLRLLDHEAGHYVDTMVRALSPKEGQSRGEFVVQVTVPLYEHVALHQDLYRLILSDALFTRTRGYFCKRVTHRVAHRTHVISDQECNTDLAIYASISECLSTLKWWADHDFAQSPRYMAEQTRYQHTDSMLWVARTAPATGRRPVRTAMVSANHVGVRR